VDADDYVIENTLDKIVQYLCTVDQPDLLFLGWESFRKGGEKENANLLLDRERLSGASKRQVFEYLSSCPRFPGLVWAKLFKRKIIEDNSLRFKPSMDAGEDIDFTFDFMLVSKCFDSYNIIFYQYRAKGANSLTTANGDIKNAKAFLYIISKYAELARGKHRDYDEYILAILANYYIALLANADKYVASLPKRSDGWSEIKKWQWLLSSSVVRSRKMKLMSCLKSIFGLRITASLSHLYVKFIR
jgi:hypothetical protein